MNFKDCCRTCLSDNNKEMRNIDATVTIAGEDVRLSDILLSFYDHKISPEDPFPKTLCISCVHQLTITVSFKNLIESSAKKLWESNLIDSYSDFNNGDFASDHEQDFKSEIKVHRKIKHEKQSPAPTNEVTLFCVECKAEFHSVKSLNEHCTKNHSNKLQTGRDCNYCNEKFEDFRSLVLHRKLHLKPYICENCWEGFFSIKDLNSHSCSPSTHKTKDRSDRLLRQCDQCGKSYPPGYIRIHMLTHSKDRPYSCKFCPKKFKVPGGLHSHVLWNHKRTRNHKCEVCNATFISSSSRSSHIRKNHLKEKKYGCETCEKRFFSKSELQRHSLTHTGVKNFHCHLCDKAYQTRYGLNVHLKSHTQMSVLGL